MRLITNIEGVRIFVHGAFLRIHCTGLVISRNALGGGNTPQRVTGYMGSAKELFDLHPRCDYLDYSLGELRPSGSTLRVHSGEAIPMGAQQTLTFADGTTLELELPRFGLPLDIEDFDENNDLDMEIALDEKSIRYWVQPDFPVAAYLPVDQAAEALAELRFSRPHLMTAQP